MIFTQLNLAAVAQNEFGLIVFKGTHTAKRRSQSVSYSVESSNCFTEFRLTSQNRSLGNLLREIYIRMYTMETQEQTRQSLKSAANNRN